jgi:hypothetical protein
MLPRLLFSISTYAALTSLTSCRRLAVAVLSFEAGCQPILRLGVAELVESTRLPQDPPV